MTGIIITGTAETISAIRDIGSEIERIAADQAKITAGRAFKSAQKTLNKTGAGNPSNPDEAPNKQTGDLRASLFQEQSSEFSYRIGTRLQYGKILEYGARHMKRRPWLIPSVMKYRKQFYAALNTRIRRTVAKMGVERAKVRFDR